jgi:regulation of enolase protein 1 (concanavalin A-like superfamily)
MILERPMSLALTQAKAFILFLAFSIQTGQTELNEIVFKDSFQNQLKPGWAWIRGHESYRKVTKEALKIRMEPGNMWGGANDARNILVRPIPDHCEKACEIEVTVFNRPTEQYEQVDLVWHYNDSYQVKIGQELVDGQLSIVMGREENDRTRTIAIIPLDAFEVRLRLRVTGNKIEGAFKKKGTAEWEIAGDTDLPIHGSPKITIQCYKGPLEVERWAKIWDFTISQISGTTP